MYLIHNQLYCFNCVVFLYMERSAEWVWNKFTIYNIESIGADGL